MHAIARCTSLIRQTHWPLYLNYPNSVATRARSPAIMQLRDALLSYAKHIGRCALNPNSVGTCARSPAIMQLRDALLLYAKHIGHFASNPNSVANRTRSQAIMHCEMHFSPMPNTLATAKSIVGLVLGLKHAIMYCEMHFCHTANTVVLFLSSEIQ